jgi:hypothetical protein
MTTINNTNNAIVLMSDCTPYLLQSLVLAKSIRDSGNNMDILLMQMTPPTEEKAIDARKFLADNQDQIKQLGVKVLQMTEDPCDIEQVQSFEYKERLKFSKQNTLDLYKFYCWTLTGYDKVLFLDSDMLVRKNLSSLFNLDYDFIYSDGPASPLNSGMFLLKPCLKTFESLRSMVLKGDFSESRGWNGLGRKHEFFNAMDVCQGIFYYYFTQMNSGKSTYKVERKYYNNQTPFEIFNSRIYREENRLQQDLAFDEVSIVHFTGWGRAYHKNGEQYWNGDSFGKVAVNNKVDERIRVPFHQEWLTTLQSLNLKH